MAPFHWPTVANNLQLATEVAARRPNSPSDWEVIAVVLSQAFSTDDNQIWNRRIQQPHAAFGGHLNLYKRHAGPKKKEKRKQKKKEKEEKQKAMEMRAAALNGIAKRRNSVMESEDESSSSSGEGSDTTIASACPSSSKGKKGPRKKIQHRATKQSAMEMLANKYNQKAELKEKELELRKMELEFQQKKYEAEAEERKAKIHLELEERKAMLALLKDRL
ncbi:uncharacterized protein LOC144661147 [Oculina patagonica]